MILTESRRGFIKKSVFSALSLGLINTTREVFASDHSTNRSPLRFGLTPVISYHQSKIRTLFSAYFLQTLGREVIFFERQKYSDIVEMLRNNELDLAWLCGFPYVRNSDALALLVTPLYQEKPLYQSYLITHSSNQEAQSILDFEDQVYAFSDTDSFSGHIIPKHRLLQLNQNPETFFKKTIFTYRHEWVIDAVSQGLAAAGSVDGYVWDTLAKQQPEKIASTRVVCKSNQYGFPPLVVPYSLSFEDKASLNHAFLKMPNTPIGIDLLKLLNLTGFQEAQSSLYDPIREISTSLNALKQGAMNH